jgi:hypothetical protein
MAANSGFDCCAIPAAAHMLALPLPDTDEASERQTTPTGRPCQAAPH